MKNTKQYAITYYERNKEAIQEYQAKYRAKKKAERGEIIPKVKKTENLKEYQIAYQKEYNRKKKRNKNPINDNAVYIEEQRIKLIQFVKDNY